MRVVWTERAIDDLDQIETYIARVNPEAGASFADLILKRSFALRRFPRMGRIVPELRQTKLRELIEGNYRIVYRIAPKRIEILTVFEAHRIPDWKEAR